MTTEPTTTPQAPPAWGDPQPPAPKWSGKKTAIAVAVAVVIAAVGGVAIYAGTSSSDTAQQGFGGGGRMGGFNRGQMAVGTSLMRDALHGDFTVSENGSYVSERMQTGEVTAVSATSITVKSADGYPQTYTIDSSTQKANNPANGSNVTVLAKVSSDTATATSITDSSQTPTNGQGGPGAGRPNGGHDQHQGSSN